MGHDTLAWEASGGWTYALPDPLGSVRQTVDAAGDLTAAREPVLSVAEGWTPYGVEVNGAQSGLGFTGEWFDADVGLQYLRARWYDAEVGRFTRVDPWYGNLERPQSQGGFSYVVNNPIRLLDPLGLCETDPYDPYVDYDCWRIAYDISAVSGGLSVFGQLSYEGLRDYYHKFFIVSNPDRPSLHRLSESPDEIIRFSMKQPGDMDCGLTSLAMAITLLQYRQYGIDNRGRSPQQVINLAKVIPVSGYTPEGGNWSFTIGRVARHLGWQVRFTMLNQKQDLVSAIDRDEVTLVAYGEMEYAERQTCYWSPLPGGGGCVTTTAVPVKLHWAHMMLLYAYSETTKHFGFLDPSELYYQQIHWIPEHDFLAKWNSLFSQMWRIQ